MRHRPAALIVFGGLPGTGKTTLSRELARRLSAAHLRVDVIEQALRSAGHGVGPLGYGIANALAAENLQLGGVVIADCVNPVQASREGWRQTALRTSAHLIEIEMICSDPALHRQRVEQRASDIDGLRLPTWEEVVGRHYEPWDHDHLVLDAAIGSRDGLLNQAEVYIRDRIG
jgi:predicted kinase